MGAHALRDGALDNDEVTAIVAEQFVPMWVNVRAEPLPPFPSRDDILLGAQLDSDGRIMDLGSKGFFLRVLVLDPRDLELLNPQAESVGRSVGALFADGAFAYAQVRPRGVRKMLDAALEVYRERPDPDTAISAVE